jgi:gluconolactonase
LAHQFEGKPLNLTNDLAYKSDGTLYFTELGHVPPLEHEVPSIYSLKGGNLRRLAADRSISFNGLAFSPDEKYLYATSSGSRIWRWDVANDGSLTNSRLFIDLAPYESDHPDWTKGITDGIKVDARGNIYSTGLGGVWILAPDGRPLGTILGLNRPANLAFGGDNGRTLYVTSRPGLYRVQLKVAGARH